MLLYSSWLCVKATYFYPNLGSHPFSALCDSKSAAFLALVHRLGLAFSAFRQGGDRCDSKSRAFFVPCSSLASWISVCWSVCDRCDSKKAILLGIYARARSSCARSGTKSTDKGVYPNRSLNAEPRTKKNHPKHSLQLNSGWNLWSMGSCVFSIIKLFRYVQKTWLKTHVLTHKAGITIIISYIASYIDSLNPYFFRLSEMAFCVVSSSADEQLITNQHFGGRYFTWLAIFRTIVDVSDTKVMFFWGMTIIYPLKKGFSLSLYPCCHLYLAEMPLFRCISLRNRKWFLPIDKRGLRNLCRWRSPPSFGSNRLLNPMQILFDGWADGFSRNLQQLRRLPFVVALLGRQLRQIAQRFPLRPRRWWRD